jgi:hypothetical protein
MRLLDALVIASMTPTMLCRRFSSTEIAVTLTVRRRSSIAIDATWSGRNPTLSSQADCFTSAPPTRLSPAICASASAALSPISPVRLRSPSI